MLERTSAGDERHATGAWKLTCNLDKERVEQRLVTSGGFGLDKERAELRLIRRLREPVPENRRDLRR